METKSTLAIVMGIIIVVADVYWTYTSYQNLVWLVLGIVILIASLVWIGLDWSLSRQTQPVAGLPPKGTTLDE